MKSYAKKILWLVLVSASLPLGAATRPATISNFVGIWEFVEVDRLNESVTYLVIKSNSWSICGKLEDCRGEQPERSVERYGDFLILKYLHEGRSAHTIVLGGWQMDEESILFGTRYLYDDQSLINGLPVLYRRVTHAGTPRPTK